MTWSEASRRVNPNGVSQRRGSTSVDVDQVRRAVFQVITDRLHHQTANLNLSDRLSDLGIIHYNGLLGDLERILGRPIRVSQANDHDTTVGQFLDDILETSFGIRP